MTGEKSLGIIGDQAEALMLSVLFAEAKVPNFLVGNIEPLKERRLSRSPLDEARWLLGIHSGTGMVEILEDIDDLPFTETKNIVLASHFKEFPDAPRERRIRTVARNMAKGSNLILTGLARPGHTATISEMVQTHGGLRHGRDFHVSYLPLLWNGERLNVFRETPRIIAGAGGEVDIAVQELFLNVFPSISATRRIRAAEAAGLFTPVYRDVVGALELELARLCVGEGVDFRDALDLSRGLGLSSLTSPRSFPGRDSVGSEIMLSMSRAGAGPRLIRAARLVNEESNRQIVAMVKGALERCGHRLRHSKIAILGLEGLGVNSRLSPDPPEILETLKRRGASLSVYAGNRSTWSFNRELAASVRLELSVTKAVEKAQCAVIAMDRLEDGELNPQKLASEMSHPAAVCDLTGVLEASNVERAGLLYASFGRGIPES
jgi:UDP-N-acetyl-D-mannosaminuronate dehydrogenase